MNCVYIYKYVFYFPLVKPRYGHIISNLKVISCSIYGPSNYNYIQAGSSFLIYNIIIYIDLFLPLLIIKKINMVVRLKSFLVGIICNICAKKKK